MISCKASSRLCLLTHRRACVSVPTHTAGACHSHVATLTASHVSQRRCILLGKPLKASSQQPGANLQVCNGSMLGEYFISLCIVAHSCVSFVNVVTACTTRIIWGCTICFGITSSNLSMLSHICPVSTESHLRFYTVIGACTYMCFLPSALRKHRY